MKNTGRKFEDKIHEVLKEILDKGEVFNPKNWKLFRKKGYYSKDRDKEIITDVSLEFYLPDASVASIIWVWECKDYKGKIPVDDIEEFHAKLEQIGADNTKGTVITSDGCFQKGAINYALSKKIGLARLMPDNQIDHVKYCSPPDWWFHPVETAINALTELSFKSENWNLYSIYSKDTIKASYSLEGYIKDELSSINGIENE